jgi:prepilin-type N-terminal cleavage/methylation domain-containing protein
MNNFFKINKISNPAIAKAIPDNLAFTLVELIVVITILAIM